MSVNKNVHDVEVALGLVKGELIEEGVELEKFTPEWFKEKGQEFAAIDVEAQKLYADFQSKFGSVALTALSGEDLLKALFLGGNTDNLCHELEYVKRNNDLFASIKGGNAYKYPLFFDKETNTWMTGTRYSPVGLSLADAIIKGTAVRDGLLKSLEVIEAAKPIDTVADYLALYTKLYEAIPDLVDSMWVIKYFHMMVPELIPVFYSKDWQEKVLKVIKLNPSDSTYGRLGQIDEFVKKCELSNVVFAQVFYKYCKDVDSQDDEVFNLVSNTERLKGGENIILYGVPGAGKSYTIETEYCKDEDRMERLVFHPDYTYSDFVGQILPSIDESGESKTIQYKFEAGPFTTLLKKAYRDPENKYYLVIEEINRGNAPAIFGDVFQLLDRKTDGTSMFGITNTDIAKIVYDDPNHKVRIPSNMSILCTMNTSDQNVFTLDTAFQRRWNMRLIENTFKENDKLANIKILDSSVTWRVFQETINEIILNTNVRLTSAEDKRLGTHFVAEKDLKYNDKADKGTGQEQIDAKLENRRFAEKVIKYLWDDAFKFNRESLFNVRDNGTNNSLEAIIRSFLGAKGDARFDIFLDNIKRTMIDESKPKDEATGGADGTTESN